MSAPNIGDRKQKLGLGGGAGAVAGGAVFLALHLLLDGLPKGTQEGVSFAVAASGVIAGGAAGLALMTGRTTVSAARRCLTGSTGFGTLVGLAIGVLAAPVGGTAPGAMVLILTGMGAFTGIIVGVIEAERIELGEQDSCDRRLAEQRAELEAAIAERFGPLDAARRAAIQTWDADRLSEARRKLDDARSVEEVES